MTDEELATETVAQEAALEGLASCSVNGGPSSPVVCATEVADTSVKRVTVTFDERQLSIPRDRRSIAWSVHSGDGAVTVVSGCVTGAQNCVFDVQPTCTKNPSDKVILAGVTIKDVRSSFTEEGAIAAVIPNSTSIFSPSCLLQRFIGCVARPAAAPIMAIFSQSCGGLHTMVAHPVEGQTHTQFQTKPRVPFVSWDQVSDSFSFPGITADVSSGSCSGDANGDFLARARACNECGCGPWSSEARFTYFNGECR